MRSFSCLGLVGALVFCEPAFAQKLVDPNAVAPEYREAAEKRRAEQIRQRECAHKADEAKVLPRDRTAHITRCLADNGPTKTSAVALIAGGWVANAPPFGIFRTIVPVLEAEADRTCPCAK